MLVLAGCGKKEQHYKTADGGDLKLETTGSGEASVVTTTAADGSQSRIETGGTWPAALATLAPAYPGGKIATTMSGNQQDTQSAMAAFDTADAPAKVIEFYKARATAAGLTGTMNMESGEGSMFVASDEKTGRTLSVQTSVEDGKTSAVVSASTKKP
ncbi:hypothetical protein BXU08_00545 [Sphingomonas sp. LM7]|nr:hypothetical protein BXU08_00545 [Sphingomonas sp. LM7]